jgi:hypothetical protein
MLYRTADLSVNKVLTLSGRELSPPKWTKSQRAAFAPMVLHGELELTDVTQAQLCRLSRVSHAYLKRTLALPWCSVSTWPRDCGSSAGTSEQLAWRPQHP